MKKTVISKLLVNTAESVLDRNNSLLYSHSLISIKVGEYLGSNISNDQNIGLLGLHNKARGTKILQRLRWYIVISV